MQAVKDLPEELLRNKFYRTIAQLQADLDEVAAWYNAKWPHQGLHDHGQPPVQVIGEFLAVKAEITAGVAKGRSHGRGDG